MHNICKPVHILPPIKSLNMNGLSKYRIEWPYIQTGVYIILDIFHEIQVFPSIY